jgi:hypothetical protein
VRRNGVLAERMQLGRMDAWADPGAMLEFISDPNERLVEGAFECAIVAAINGGRWMEEARSNVEMCLAANWVLDEWRYPARLIGVVSTMDLKVRAKAAEMVYRECFRRGIMSHGKGEEAPIVLGRTGIFMLESVFKFWKYGDISGVKASAKKNADVLSEEYVDRAVILNWMVTLCNGSRGTMALSMAMSEIEQVSGYSMKELFYRTFPDPIIWVNKHQIIRRRR